MFTGLVSATTSQKVEEILRALNGVRMFDVDVIIEIVQDRVADFAKCQVFRPSGMEMQIGDVVQFSRNLKMTVRSMKDTEITCNWFDDKSQLLTETFHKDELWRSPE